MKIKQNTLSGKTEFEFLDEALKYKIEDSGGSLAFSIPYGDIPAEGIELKLRNIFLGTTGWLLFTVGFFFALLNANSAEYNYEVGGYLLGAMLLGIIFYIGYHFSAVSMTIFQTDKGEIRVLKGAKHDEVLKEIDRRRKKQWYQWYADIDYSNAPENEIDKFKWLLDHDVITDREYQDAVEKIEAHHDPAKPKSSNSSSKTVN